MIVSHGFLCQYIGHWLEQVNNLLDFFHAPDFLDLETAKITASLNVTVTADYTLIYNADPLHH